MRQRDIRNHAVLGPEVSEGTQRGGGPAGEVFPGACATSFSSVPYSEPPRPKQQTRILPQWQMRPRITQLHSNNGGVNF